MRKRINQDIKKWHEEIAELLESQNINNYEFTFFVPNGDTLHQFGYGNRASKLASVSCLMENTLLEFAIANNNNLKDNKDCFLARCYVDDFMEHIKNTINQKIKKHVKEPKKVNKNEK
jgi:hypothetical protein